MHASPSATRVAKMRASGQLQELRLSLHASVLPAMFSPRISRDVRGGVWLQKEPLPHRSKPPGHSLQRGQFHSIFFLSTTLHFHYCSLSKRFLLFQFSTLQR